MLTWFNAQPTWAKVSICVGVPVVGVVVYTSIRNRKKIVEAVKRTTKRKRKPGRPKTKESKAA